MTEKTALAIACDTLGWSSTELARRLGCDDRLARRWLNGDPRYSVPSIIVEWCEALAREVVARPAPARATWR